LLLRGDAVDYAVRGQDARGLRFGTRAVKPDIARDVSALVAKKVLISSDLIRSVSSGRHIAGYPPAALRSRENIN
jgi:hypothetical protein